MIDCEDERPADQVFAFGSGTRRASAVLETDEPGRKATAMFLNADWAYVGAIQAKLGTMTTQVVEARGGVKVLRPVQMAAADGG